MIVGGNRSSNPLQADCGTGPTQLFTIRRLRPLVQAVMQRIRTTGWAVPIEVVRRYSAARGGGRNSTRRPCVPSIPGPEAGANGLAELDHGGSFFGLTHATHCRLVKRAHRASCRASLHSPWVGTGAPRTFFLVWAVLRWGAPRRTGCAGWCWHVVQQHGLQEEFVRQFEERRRLQHVPPSLRLVRMR